MIEKEIKIVADTSDADDGIAGLTDAIKDLNKTVVDGNKRTEDGLKGVESASKKATKGFRTMGLAIKAMGIGLILEAFSLLKEVLGENQAALDFATTSFNFMSIAVNDLIENIDSVVSWFGKLGSAVSAVFKGQFGLAAVIVKDAVKDLTDYTEATYEAAEGITELANRAAIAAAQNQGLIEKYDRQAEKLRQIRDDDTKNIYARIEANNELAKVLEQQEKAMLRNVDIMLASAQAEYDRNQNVENEVALIEARNEKLAVQAQIEGFRSEQMINTNALAREENELKQDGIDLLAKELEAEQKYFEESQRLLEEHLRTEEELEMDAEDRRVEREYQARKQSERNAQIEADAKIEIQLAYLDATAAGFGILASFAEESKGLQAASIIAENATGIAKNIITTQAANGRLTLEAGVAAPALITANNIRMGIGIAMSAAAAAKGLAALGGGGSASSGGGSQPAAPSFNLVEGTGTNQIADTIDASNQTPVKAYVVAQDMTNQQTLNRNIRETASL